MWLLQDNSSTAASAAPQRRGDSWRSMLMMRCDGGSWWWGRRTELVAADRWEPVASDKKSCPASLTGLTTSTPSGVEFLVEGGAMMFDGLYGGFSCRGDLRSFGWILVRAVVVIFFESVSCTFFLKLLDAHPMSLLVVASMCLVDVCVGYVCLMCCPWSYRGVVTTSIFILIRKVQGTIF